MSPIIQAQRNPIIEYYVFINENYIKLTLRSVIEKAFEYNNESTPSIYCNIAQVYSKMNKLEESIKILEQGKRSRYYKIKHFQLPLSDVVKDDTFVKVIDAHLREYENKLIKGYIYKPRKKA